MGSQEEQKKSKFSLPKEDIAIIGMACIYPGAPDLQKFWENIVSKTDAISEVDPEVWDPEVFYDKNPNTENKLRCKRGGYIEDFIDFNPLKYGIMPVAVTGGETDQFLTLRMAYEALADAGYPKGLLEKEQTKVILGRGNYFGHGNTNILQHTAGIEGVIRILKELHPEHTDEDLDNIRKALRSSLPNFSPENALSMTPNMTTGRIANRLDFMGSNFTVDAACASALIASDLGVRDLLTGTSDTVLIGGVHVCMNIAFLMVFDKMGAMSSTSEIRPFDEKADGLIPGEGLGIIVLKRLEDAERDGDRIYAVIKGVGTSSDGRSGSVLAPHLDGELLSLSRAYEMAGIDPNSIELIEGHGTATPVGDSVELKALYEFFGERESDIPPGCALGSVKSMIGHTMPASGAASIIKTALALYHKVLPPSIKCDEPSSEIDWSKSTIYVNTETRPWIHGKQTPRRAGVNAFGFGGVNGHVIIEEYVNSKEDESLLYKWDSEVLVLQAQSRQEITEKAQKLHRYISDWIEEDQKPEFLLRDLAYTLNSDITDVPYRLSLIAESPEDLKEKLELALKRLDDPERKKIQYMNGVFYFEEPLTEKGKLAFMFSGEGSQYLNMLSDLCIHFPDVREFFDTVDQAAIQLGNSYLPSHIIFPPPAFTDEEKKRIEKYIWETDGAVQAVLAADWAMNTLMTALEIKPDMLVGHSTGEFCAMVASGILELDPENTRESLVGYFESFAELSRTTDTSKLANAVMIAVGANLEKVSSLVEQVSGEIYVAMDNCPHQVVAVGTEEAGLELEEKLKNKGLLYEKLMFDRAYHTPMFADVCEMMKKNFQQWTFNKPKTKVYSCTTTQPYPDDPRKLLDLTIEHWMSPVEFRKTIDSMYEDGARIFVEVGPRGNLTAFVDDILRGKEYLAISANVQRRSGITQLNHLIGILAAHGVPMKLEYLYKRRSPNSLSMNFLEDRNQFKYVEPGTMKLNINFPNFDLDNYSPPEKDIKEETPPEIDVNKEVEVKHSIEPGHSELIEEAEQYQEIDEKPQQMPAFDEEMEYQITPTENSNPVPVEESDFILSEYMKTMEQFLEVQEHVMQAFLDGNENNEFDATSESDQERSAVYPFIGEVISHTPGQEITILKKIDLDEEIFLLDHTIGGQMSVDETLTVPPIIPLTFSMEIMAEIAALLQPGKILTGMKNVQATQWIMIEENEPVFLEISAKKQPSKDNEFKTQIRNLGVDPGVDLSTIPVVTEGVMVFSDEYEIPEQPYEFSPDEIGEPKITANQLYEDRYVFHGPKFQGVKSIDKYSSKGIEATFESLSTQNFFRSIPNPYMLTDPVLLDCAAQIFGYWSFEQLDRGNVVFPVGVDHMQIFNNKLPPGQNAKCRVRIKNVNPMTVKMDADIIAPDGNLWIRMSGFKDWRFYFRYRNLVDFGKFPGRIVASKSFSDLARCLQEDMASLKETSIYCFLIDIPYSDLERFWTINIIHQILSRNERNYYKTLNWTEDKKYEWTLGRMAAKDAVRVYINQNYGLQIFPADIEIIKDQYGRPMVEGYWSNSIDAPPVLSIAHSKDIGVAVAGDNNLMLGIDIEAIAKRDPGFEKLAFTQEEIVMLESADSEQQKIEMQTMFWCAKEAVAKALGRGFMNSPRDIVISGYSGCNVGKNIEVIETEIRGKLLNEFPKYASIKVKVYTKRHNEFILGVTNASVD
ncbi:acyltransferase domain-containing protein [Candidatus Poribacteria bacterium]|nr:acyltransferase domain-containing protein [Candidatus Poribacteria bacterium]